MSSSGGCAQTHRHTSTHTHTHSPPSLPPSLPPSHFHLDHCGALPYFTEMVGYDGPLYMTQPTKAICPILLVRICVCVCACMHNTSRQVYLGATSVLRNLLQLLSYVIHHVAASYPSLTSTTPCCSPPLPSPPPPFPPPCLCHSTQEDYRKITVEKKGETNFFTSQMIKDCMKKVTAVSLHQTVKVGHLALNMHSCILPTLPPPLTPPHPTPPPPPTGRRGVGDQGILCWPCPRRSHVSGQGGNPVICLHCKWAGKGTFPF